MAQKTQNLGLEVFDFATDSTPAFVNGVAGLENSNMHKIDKAIGEKVKIEGEVNCIDLKEDNFIQNGLVADIKDSEDFLIFAKIKAPSSLLSGDVQAIGSANWINKTGFSVQFRGIGTLAIAYVDGQKINYKTIENYSFNKEYNLTLVKKSNTITFSCLGVTLTGEIVESNNAVTFNGKYVLSKVIYNKHLTPIGITHNLNKLNATPSIKLIQTPTYTYAISSDEDHVEMSTGKTLRQEYTNLIKSNIETFESNGSEITVHGAMESRVMGMKLEGGEIVNNVYDDSSYHLITNQNESKLYDTSSPIDSSTVQPNKIYTIFVEILKNTQTSPFRAVISDPLSTFDFAWTIQNPTEGIYLKVAKSITDFSKCTRVITSANSISTSTLDTGTIQYRRWVVEGDVTDKFSSYIPIGLNLTKAIISNNNQQYSIYMPTIQGKTKVMKATKGTQNWVEIDASETRDTTKYDYKLESINGDLGGVPSTYDYIDRVRKVRVVNTKEVVLNGSENWSKSNEFTTSFLMVIDDENTLSADIVAVSCDKEKPSKAGDLTVDGVTGIAIRRNNAKGIVVSILKSKLTTQDVAGFKAYLASNPVTVRYQLATPIEVPLTDAELGEYDEYREIIELSGIGDVRDSLEIKEDGSGVLTQKAKRKVIDGTENWTLHSSIPNLFFTVADTSLGMYATNEKAIIFCDSYEVNNYYPTQSGKISGGGVLNPDRFAIKDESCPTTQDLLSKLQQKPITVIYQLATPITTIIPKELIPSIITESSNTFKVESPIGASKLSVSVPMEKVRVDGIAQNVNFIRNEIVKDGLVDVQTILKASSDLSVIFEAKNLTGSQYLIKMCDGLYAKNNGWVLETSSLKAPRMRTATNIYAFTSVGLVEDVCEITLVKKGLTFYLTLDGVIYSVTVDNFIDLDTSIVSANNSTIRHLYNRPLSSQEIQHNLSVLNNTPSINEINDYTISTDTDHIEDRTGRTTEQINRVFYKNMCKEFTSDGNSITVNNGMDGYLLGGKIEGQTIKCIWSDEDWITNSIGGWAISSVYYNDKIDVKPNTTYVIVTEVKENTKTTEFRVVDTSYTAIFNTKINIPLGKTGVFKNTITSLSDFSEKPLILQSSCSSSSTTGSITYRRCLIEINNDSLVNSYIPFGLSSTQAVISNNQMKYSFYKDATDKASGTVLTLDGVGGMNDTLDILEDGSGLFTQNIYRGTIIDAVENKILFKNSGWSDLSATVDYYFAKLNKWSTTSNEALCDNLRMGIANGRNTQTCLSLERGDVLYVLVEKGTDISTVNNYKIAYQLKTPIITTIPKELMPTILTQLSNTINVDSPVAPSKVTIQAPTTDDVKKSYEVTLLNNYSQTLGTAKPIVDLTNTDLIRLQLDVTAPSSSMNSTIFTLPTELRPKTNSRIQVFVNGVSQLATINASTGNVTLGSTPSASANVYIKTDYRKDI